VKVYCASLTHESNSFSPLPTDMASFRELFLCRPSAGEGVDILDQPLLECNLRMLSLERGWEVVDGLYAGANPSAPTVRRDYESLQADIVEPLRAAMPVDMVLLFLHGAQMAEGYDDCEGAILEAVRAVVGPDVTIGVELDLHCNITPAMIGNADIIIACKEYPHTDFLPRARELAGLCEAAAKGEIKPVMAFARTPMLGFFHTTREPMRSFVHSLFAEEKREGILSVSLAHGFPASDFEHVGAGVIVVTDGDAALAEATAQRLAEAFFSLREEIAAPGLSTEDALAEALAIGSGPVVIADASDNPGGGAAGDSTHFLRAMIDAGITDAAVGHLWDPAAYDLIERAGIGASIPLRIGGKSGPLAGDPVDAVIEVMCIRDDLRQLMFDEPVPLGPAASVRVGGIEIVITRVRNQTFGPQTFIDLGIDIPRKRIVVVKSAQHFHTQFAPLAAGIVYASPPGSVSTDFASYPYRRIQRPIWPLDTPPFSAFGQDWKA
jgi:microcystin degradation protein MlrC